MKITLTSPTSWIESESCLFLFKSIPCVSEYNSKINIQIIESNRRAGNEHGCLFIVSAFQIVPRCTEVVASEVAIEETTRAPLSSSGFCPGRLLVIMTEG